MVSSLPWDSSAPRSSEFDDQAIDPIAALRFVGLAMTNETCHDRFP